LNISIKYYFAKTVPPPDVPPYLIKESGNRYEKWTRSGWTDKGDILKYFMGDYELREVSLQEAEEHMRTTALHLH
jgi:hypothetical protein